MSMTVAFATMVIASACAGDGATEPATGLTQLIVSANVVGTPIATLVVNVSGNGIPTQLTFNLTMNNGVASGTVKVPPGPARTFLVQAMDDQSNVTHEGSKTIDVRPGQNPSVPIVLVSKAGHVPITVNIGSVSVSVNPPSGELHVGNTLQLQAKITGPEGVINEAVDWATSNPAIATVSSSGLVTGVIGGPVDIVATYGGVAGIAHITVIGEIAIVGNNVQFTDQTGFGANYLLGSKITVNAPMIVTHLALIHNTGGTQIKMGLYSDVGGQPAQLKVATIATPLTPGVMEIPVTPTALSAGDYWIMGVYAVDTPGWIDFSDNHAQVDYIPFTFSNPLPSTFPSPIIYNGQKFNYYIKGTR